MPNFKYRQWRERPRRYRFRGQWLTARQIAAELGMTRDGVYKRIRRGQRLEVPPNRKVYWCNGQYMTVEQIAEYVNLTVAGVKYRLANNISLDLPIRRRRKHRAGK